MAQLEKFKAAGHTPADARLRLCLWYWGRHGGGAHYTFKMAEALAARPDVQLCLSLSQGNELIDRFRQLSVPMQEIATYSGPLSCAARTALLPTTALRFRAFLRRMQVQVVNSTMSHLWTRPMLPALHSAGASLIATVHDATLHPGEDGRLKTMLYRPPANADAYVALTDFVAGRLRDRWQLPSDRIATIPLAPLDYGQESRPASARPGVRDPQAPLRLLFLGRILRYKGMGVLADAIRDLQARGIEVRLLVAGSGDLDEAGGAALADMPSVTVENRWIGDDEVASLLEAADAVVLPYIEASQSGVVPTAFAAGVPAIVTDVGGLADQVSHGENGLIAHSSTSEAVANAVQVLHEDRDLLSRLSQHARNSSPDWRECAEMLRHLAATTIN